MKIFKKMLAVLTAALMLAFVFPLGTFAERTHGGAAPVRAEPMTSGDTGTYKPYPEAAYELKYTECSDGTLKITGYTGTASGDLIIPESIGGKSVTTIGSYAFRNCNGFTGNLVISDSVTTIGERAFCGCSGLTDVYYVGTKEQKNAIRLYYLGNEPLLNATWHYNSAGSGTTVLPALNSKVKKSE